MRAVTETAWNPWAELRRRRDVILLKPWDLPASAGGGCCIANEAGAVIVLDRRLTQVERNAVLAHELVHAERGGICNDDEVPATWAPVVAREERTVDDIAVRRLVPPESLRRWCVTQESVGAHVEPWQVAEEWRVPERVARRALELMVSS
jgi:Zn-dependent peptidase ImmA (M78 family)